MAEFEDDIVGAPISGFGTEIADATIPPVFVEIEDKEARTKLQKFRNSEEIAALNKLSTTLSVCQNTNQFFGRVLSHVDREVDWTFSPPAIGIHIHNGMYKLRFHPEFINNTSPSSLLNYLEAECLHILNAHPVRLLPLLRCSTVGEVIEKLEKHPSLATNVAKTFDFLVSCEFKDINRGFLPKSDGFLTPEDLNLQPHISYRNETAEELLKEICRNSPQEGKESFSSSSHSKWFSKKSKAISRDQLEASLMTHTMSLLNRAALEQRLNHGTVPGNYIVFLDAFQASEKIPWNKILRDDVASSIAKIRESGYLKADKTKLALSTLGNEVSIYPSTQNSEGICLLFVIDTSGSMSQEDISLGISEVVSVAKNFTSVCEATIIYCDAQIQREVLLQGDYVQNDEDELLRIPGGGGTSFNPPLIRNKFLESAQSDIYVSQESFESRLKTFNKPDVIVYFTDGYADEPPISLSPDCPMFWILTQSGKEVESFGRNIKLD